LNVTFRHFGAHLASSRYRSIIPAQQLQKAGHGIGTDWLVIGKHGWSWRQQVAGFDNVCFDVCDDHFDGPHADHYVSGCRLADVVTVNSDEMARKVYERTGRKAVVIPDPFEQPEKEARVHDSLLWFGHQSNLGDLMPWMSRLEKLEIVTTLPAVHGITQWSPETMDRAFDRAGIVVIPTGKSLCKSGNRAIESIRRGLFVVAGFLPAYADLGVYIGDIEDGVKWALSNQDEVMRRIKASQAYVAQTYSPERIGEQWIAALSS
jgi:hypothetical protein